MPKHRNESGPSRRDVVKGSLFGLTAGSLWPQAAPAQNISVPQSSTASPKAGSSLDADVVVVGGGMAGVCTALAAARNGASVILVQDRPMLGGNSSSEIRLHVLGSDASGHRKTVDARETGIMEELRLIEAASNPQRSYSVWDVILYDAVRSEPNITLLLNTHCCGVLIKSTGGQAGPRATGSLPARVFTGGQAAGGTKTGSGTEITAIIASRYSTEHSFTIHGRVFVDCSGDGRLGVEAGADFRVGREAKSEYGESMAMDKADSHVLGSTILFQTRQYEKPMPFKAPVWARKFESCADLPFRSHGNWEWGHWWVAWGGELDTIADNERIRDELMANALGLWDHIKNSGQHPTSENWALDWIGFLPGKRESRRFMGEHVLTQQEVQRGEVFEDGVAIGGWPIDLHPPAGIYSKEKPCNQVYGPLYNIPFRCLVSRNIRNLMFAGRNASMSHVAFGSTRVMATGGAMGQAVGTAAAMCARAGLLPAHIARDGIPELQQRLLRDDAYIIGASNRDPADLARQADVRASSQTTDGPATAVINGITRGVGGACNRWISDPAQSLPQTLELRFREPVRLREVHLAFDTGLHRALTLTLQDSYNARFIHGVQPETVRDYEVQLMDADQYQTVAKVTGNYQRKRIHRLDPPVKADGLRLLVTATNGDKSARLFEIRAYA